MVNSRLVSSARWTQGWCSILFAIISFFRFVLQGRYQGVWNECKMVRGMHLTQLVLSVTWRLRLLLPMCWLGWVGRIEGRLSAFMQWIYNCWRNSLYYSHFHFHFSHNTHFVCTPKFRINCFQEEGRHVCFQEHFKTITFAEFVFFFWGGGSKFTYRWYGSGE